MTRTAMKYGLPVQTGSASTVPKTVLTVFMPLMLTSFFLQLLIMVSISSVYRFQLSFLFRG